MLLGDALRAMTVYTQLATHPVLHCRRVILFTTFCYNSPRAAAADPAEFNQEESTRKAVSLGHHGSMLLQSKHGLLLMYEVGSMHIGLLRAQLRWLLAEASLDGQIIS